MTAQTFLLHARARQLPLLALGVAVTAVLTKWAGDFLLSLPLPQDRIARVPVTAAAPLLVATLLAPGLAGADPGLERSTPPHWRLRRLVHLLAATVLTGLALVLAGLDRPFAHGAAELARNTVGCIGLVAVGAIALGTHLAWAPALSYLSVVYVASPPPGQATVLDHIWAWPMYSSSILLSTVAALVLWGLGVTLYTLAVPKRRTQFCGPGGL